MPVTTLDIAPQDVSARALALRLCGPRPAHILAERTLTSPGVPFALSLGILGASHVIDLSLPSDATSHPLHLFREEISCNAHEGGRALAAGVVEEEGEGYEYRMRARHHACTEDELARSAQRILAQSASEGAGNEVRGASAQWLVGTFPGAGNFHITALRGEVSTVGARWRTWHFYPEELAIVETESEWTGRVRA